LENFTGWLLHADGGEFAVEFGLGGERCGAGILQTDVQFGDVQVESERGEALKVGSYRSQHIGIVERKIHMELEADAVERHSAGFEVLRHGVNGVRLHVHGFIVVVVVEELGSGVGGVRPVERLFNVLRPHPREANAGLVIPDGVADDAGIVEGLVDHVPGIDFPCVVLHHRGDVALENGRKLGRSVISHGHPRRDLIVPDQGVTADDHGVRLGVGDQSVGAGEVIDAERGMDDAKLHFVFGLELAVLGTESRRVTGVASQIRRIGGRADVNIVGSADLAQSPRRRSCSCCCGAAASACEYEGEKGDCRDTQGNLHERDLTQKLVQRAVRRGKPESTERIVSFRVRSLRLEIGPPATNRDYRLSPSKTNPVLLLVNIGQLLTLSARRSAGPRRGAHLRDLGIVQDAAVMCVGGRIVSVGKTKDALRDCWIRKNRKRIVEIDCSGKVVLPGFVDSHTHPAFISPRLVDFEKRVSGATYEQIAQAGGGIRSSVLEVRKAGKAQLATKVLAGLQEMSSHGTTTVEAKSGYGLTLDAELKSLEAIRTAATQWPGTVVPTLLGAHVVPQEFKNNPQEYLTLVCEQMIPQAAKHKLAQFVDVFCDGGAFGEEDSVRIFKAARKNGLQLRAHISQLTRTPLQSLLTFHPASLDHLDHLDDGDISLLAASDTVATLVPGANYFLGLEKYPPARKLIEAGAAVALATDYNPGSSPTTNMPFVLSLACTQMKMSPAEAIAAATINGAWALRLQERKGSIEPGKDADLAVFDVSDYREVPYWVAANRCAQTVLNGELQENCQAR